MIYGLSPKGIMQSSSSHNYALPNGHLLHESLRSSVFLVHIDLRFLDLDPFNALQNGDHFSLYLSFTVQYSSLQSESSHSLRPIHILTYSLVNFPVIGYHVNVQLGCVVVDESEGILSVSR